MTQNHIHLSKTIGAAPENAPDMQWKVRQDGWLPTPNIVASYRRTLSGALKKHRLKDNLNNVIRFMDYKYIIRVDQYWGMTRQERLDALLAMQGEIVYFIDNDHTSVDGADHTAEVKMMYFSAIADVKNLDPLLQTLYLTIELKDASL